MSYYSSPTSSNPYESSLNHLGLDNALKQTVSFHMSWNKERNDLYKSSNSVVGQYRSPYVGLGGDILTREKRDLMKKVSSESLITSNLSPEEEVLRALGRNAFSSFSQDIYDLSVSGTKVINKVIGNYNIGINSNFFRDTLSSEEQDARREQWEKYVSSHVYETLFKHDVTETNEGKSLYGGLYLTKSPGWYDENQWGGDRVTIAAGNWLMNNILTGEEVNLTKRVSEFHQELLRSSIESYTDKRFGKYTDVTERVRDVSNQFLKDTDYIAKPGIKSAIAFIESAERELTIDLFQLQNKAVVDVLVSKLKRESQRIATGDFKFQLRLAGPTNSNRRNMTGLQILGPNIVALERLYNVQKEILIKEFDLDGSQTVSSKIAVSEEDKRLDINNKIAKLLPSFTIEMMSEGMYHPKLYTSEKYAMLGSFNLTSPVGNSVIQAGSNYEEIIIFHNRLEKLTQGLSIDKQFEAINNVYKGQYPNVLDRSKTLRTIGSLDTYGLSKGTSEDEAVREYIDTHLYLQARSIALSGIRNNPFTGRQVGMAGDIGQGLRSILSYAKDRVALSNKNKVEVYMNLNQVWLLQYDNDLYYGKQGDYSGEFGPIDRGKAKLNELKGIVDEGSRRSIYRGELQENLFDLLVNNQAYISVDIRNYREKVLEPMTEKVHYLLGKQEIDTNLNKYKPKGWNSPLTPSINNFSKEDFIRIGSLVFETQYNSSLDTLVSKNNNNSLAKVLGLDEYGINFRDTVSQLDKQYGKREGIKVASKGVDRTIKQLLAMTRGNIIGVTETMSHVKNVFAIERTGVGINEDTYQHIGSIIGSSNFGSESLLFRREHIHEDYSSEVGVISLSKEVRREGEGKGILYREKDNVLSEELEDFYASQATDREREWRRLTQTTVGNVETNLESTRASWESKVSATGLSEITARIKQLNKDLGMSQGEGVAVKSIYGQKGSLIALEVTVDVNNLMGYRGFNDTNVGYNPMKFRLTSLKGGLGNQGFVYLIDQNKVIGNSLFVNNTSKDIQGIPYGEGSFVRDMETGEYILNTRTVKSKESLSLSPIDSLINMVSTLGAETSYRTLVYEPFKYVQELKASPYKTHSSSLGKAGLDYLEYLSKGRIQGDKSIEFLLGISDYELSKLISTFETKHFSTNISGASRKALELTGGNTYHKITKGDGLSIKDKSDIYTDRDLGLRKGVLNSLTLLRDINRELELNNGLDIKDKRRLTRDEVKAKESLKTDIIRSIEEIFDKYIGLESVSTFQSDIALGILESRKDFLYTSKLNADIKEIKKGLLETYITQSQASTYGSAQAWFKTPLYGINENQRLFVDKLAQGNALYKYSLAQPFIFSPSSTTGKGTEGAIRGVASGGSISETQDTTGLSIYGINKTPTGDISSVHLASYSGVGYIINRSEYESYLAEILFEEYKGSLLSLGISNKEMLLENLNNPNSYIPQNISRKFFDLIGLTPFKDKGVNESLNYTFNTVKKASQIPQRLKNVLGSRPMFELDREVSYRLVTKKDVSGLISKKVYDIKLDLLSHLGKKKSYLIQEAIGYLKETIENNKDKLGIYSTDRFIEEALSRMVKPNDVKDIFSELKGLWSQVENTIGSDINVAMVSSAGFRGVLNNEMAFLVENYKKELSEEFGFYYEDFLPGSNSIARKLLLSKIKLADSMSSGIKGFTGHRDNFNPIVLVQLTGDFSDYAWANPLYGSSKDDRDYVKSILKNVNYQWNRLDRQSQAEIIGRMGTMSGFIDKSEKRQKSSKLSEEWSVKGVKLANRGDIVTFDERTNRVLVWGSIEEMMKENGGTPKDIINIDKHRSEIKLELTKAVLGDNFDKYYTYSDLENKYVVKSVVDSRDQIGILTQVIDNFRTIDDLPNVSKLDRQTWYRVAENSVEYVLDSKQLMANADNNQLLWEMVYLRASMVGGGKRVEGTGGLPKAVLKFTGLEELYETPNGKTDFFSYLTYQLNQHQGGSIKDIDSSQVFGLMSPSNLKSYFYSHGSTIVRNKEYLQNILGDLETKKGGITGKGLIASLMLGFGDSWLADDSAGLKREIYTSLFEGAMKGELGEWFRNQALSSILLGVSKDEAIKLQLEKLNFRDDISRLNNIFDTKSPVYQDTVLLRERLGEMFAKTLFSKSSELFNAQQTPSLMLLENDLILKALKGDEEGMMYIKGFLRNRLIETVGEKGSIGLIRKDFISIDNFREREAALLAASIDLVEQLKSQSKGIEIPTEIDFSNDRIVQQLAYIMGDAELDKIQLARNVRENQKTFDSLTEEEQDAVKYLELSRAILKGYTHKSTVLRMFIGPMASQSKESIGSKHTGGLEYQHLMKPMATIVTSFEETGSIASLRKVVANMMAVVAEGSTMTGLETDLSRRGFSDKKTYEFTDIRLANQTMKSKFIGLYAGYSVFNKEELSQIKKSYTTYGELSKLLTRDYIETLGQNQLLSKKERANIIRDINDLLTINPDYDDVYVDPLSGKLNEGITKADRIKEILYSSLDRKEHLPFDFESYGLKTKEDIDKLIDNMATGKLKSIGREQQLDPTKPFGIGSVSPVLDNLDYKGFSFGLPMIYQLTEESENGKVRLELDYSNTRYSYLMGGEELKAVGDSYGSFVDELVAKSLTLASAFTPGTLMSQIREKMIQARTSGGNEIALDKEEMLALRQFYSSAIGETGIIKTMAEASTGTRIQGMLAHKTRFPGAVSSPAASWMVPAGHMVLAQEALRKYSGLSSMREDMINKLTGEYNTLDSSNPLLSLDKRIYSSAITAYKQGLSQTGLSILNQIKSLSYEFQNIDSSQSDYQDKLTSLKSKVQNIIDNVDVKKEAGDSLGINLARKQLVLIDMAMGNTSSFIIDSTSDYTNEIDRLNKKAQSIESNIITLTNTKGVVDSLLESGLYSEIKQALDENERVRKSIVSETSKTPGLYSLNPYFISQELNNSLSFFSTDSKNKILQSVHLFNRITEVEVQIKEIKKERFDVFRPNNQTLITEDNDTSNYRNQLLQRYNNQLALLETELSQLGSKEQVSSTIFDTIFTKLTEDRDFYLEIFKSEFEGVLGENNKAKITGELKDLTAYQQHLHSLVTKYTEETQSIKDRITVLSNVDTKFSSKFNKEIEDIDKENLVKRLNSYISNPLFSGLENLMSTKELLEGSYKGKISPYTFDEKTFLSGLSNLEERREMFSFVIGEMKGGFSQVIEELTQRDKNTFNISENHEYITKANRDELSKLINVLDIIQKSSGKVIGVDTLDKIGQLQGTSPYSVLGKDREQVMNLGGISLEGKEGLSRSITLLESAVNNLDISDTLEVLGFRSPPVGGSEQQRMTLGLIQDIGLLNEYSKQLEGKTATFEASIRNKGLSLVTPISFLTMNLGDFDGDQYTTIFSQFMNVQRNIQNSNILIKKKEMDIAKLENRLVINGQDEELIQKIGSLRTQITYEKSKIADYNAQINIWKENLNASEFSKATKKEVANYLGIRQEMLMGKEEGGYQKVSPSLDLIFTEIYQGRDLFGGLENTLKPSIQIKNVLTTIFNESSSNNETLLSLLATGAEEQKLNQTLVSSLESIVRNERDKANESTYMSLLLVDNEARKTIIDTVKDSLNSYVIPINEKGKGQETIDNDVLFAHAASSFYSRYRGLPGLQSVLAQGAGANMTLSSYDSMIKVMGEAGGVVLGKTYNTFISTLYNDSPLLALSHVLKDETTRGLLNQAGFFDKNKEVTGSININMSESHFYRELNASTKQSESMLSFIKSINQLLRDGIKPKGGSAFLDEMKEFEGEYESLKDDPKAQQQLIKEKASFFGPSGSNVGMSAFMELSELINKRDTLSNSSLGNVVRLNDNGEIQSPWDMDTFEESQSVLRRGFGIDKDKFDSLSHHLMSMYGKDNVSAFEVAALKTQRDIETIIVAYRYNNNTGAQVYEQGSQKGFMESIKSGTIGYLQEYGIYNPALDERANLQNYIDTKFDEGTSEGSKNLYILQHMFGKSKEDIRKNYLDISSSGLQNEVLSMIEIMSTTNSMTTGMMGEAGEGLKRFTTLEGARQEAVSVIGGKSDKNIHPGMGADIWTSLINLAGSNKLSSHAIPAVFEAFSSNESLFSLYESGQGKSIEGLVPSLLSGITIDKDGKISSTFRGGRNVEDNQELALRAMLHRILEEGQYTDVEIEVKGEKVKKNLTQYILGKLETTATVAKGKALVELMDKLYGKKGDVESYLNGNNFVEGIVNRKALLKEERAKLTQEISQDNLSAKDYKEKIDFMVNQRVNEYVSKMQGSYEAAMTEFMYMSQEERRKVNNNRTPQELNRHEEFDYMNVLRKESNANKLSNLQDLIIPGVLTLIGSAVIGGRLDRETVGDVVGGSLIAASMSKGYVLSSILSERIGTPSSSNKTYSDFTKSTAGTLAKGIGTSFKFNLALQESEGDIAQAVAVTAGRELGFAVGSMLLAPVIEKGLTDSFFHMSHLMKGQKELFEKAKLGRLSKEDKLMYMLGGTKGALDSDDYIKTKGTALTMSGAVLSGVLGMFMEGVGSYMTNRAMQNTPINDFAIIEQAIDSLNNSKRENDYLISQRESSPDIFNEEGNYVYTDEISPLDEELVFSAIDNDYMDIEILASQVTSDNQYEFIVA